MYKSFVYLPDLKIYEILNNGSSASKEPAIYVESLFASGISFQASYYNDFSLNTVDLIPASCLQVENIDTNSMVWLECRTVQRSLRDQTLFQENRTGQGPQ